MREIVLDTETTGLDPREGHRLVEIGCIEIVNFVSTGKTFQEYVNPERSMPKAAYEVHGLGEEFLANQPIFKEIADSLESFLADSKLVIHNAAFDLSFLNSEFRKIGKPELPFSRTIDTVAMAREIYPGAPASLDALCRRFSIDNSARIKHGALLDAELLSEVYLELRGGRQPDLHFLGGEKAKEKEVSEKRPSTTLNRAAKRPPRDHSASEEELLSHKKLLDSLVDPLWLRKKNLSD